MKNRPTPIALLIALASSSLATAQIFYDFNDPFNGGISEGLADSLGIPADGLVWGVLTGAPLGGVLTSYDSGFTLEAGSLIELSAGGVPTGHSLFISGAGTTASFLTSNTEIDNVFEGDFMTQGGVGGIGAIPDIPNILANQSFALIWLDRGQSVDSSVADGLSFGILEDASFVFSGVGSNTVNGVPFVGEDEPRAANFGVFQTIPEPSAVMLSLLGGLALLRRRRA